MSTIQHIAPTVTTRDHEAISFHEILRRRIQRRRRVAKRLSKRFPLFAVEMMQDEFPGYTYEEYLLDIMPSKRKYKSIRHPKSQLKRQGRYELYLKALNQWHNTKDVSALVQAQYLRNRLFLPFELVWKIAGVERWLTLPSTTPYKMVQESAQVKAATMEELDMKLKEKLRYSHLG
jgi:hypothetical protein